MISKYGAKNVITLGLSISASGLFLSYCSVDGYYFALMVASFIFVAGISLTVPALIARIALMSDTSGRDLAVAIYTFLLFSGASLGPWLIRVSDFAGPQGGRLLLSIIIIICAVYSATTGRSE